MFLFELLKLYPFHDPDFSFSKATSEYNIKDSLSLQMRDLKQEKKNHSAYDHRHSRFTDSIIIQFFIYQP